MCINLLLCGIRSGQLKLDMIQPYRKWTIRLANSIMRTVTIRFCEPNRYPYRMDHTYNVTTYILNVLPLRYNKSSVVITFVHTIHPPYVQVQENISNHTLKKPPTSWTETLCVDKKLHKFSLLIWKRWPESINAHLFSTFFCREFMKNYSEGRTHLVRSYIRLLVEKYQEQIYM